MDIERFREFQIIAEEGSFQKAAERLHISPSVLSARFQRFERALGTSLLERNNHWIRLTKQGSALLAQGKDLLDTWDHTVRKLALMGNHQAASLVIQLCAQTMPSDLGIYLEMFAREHPWLFLDLYDEGNCSIRDGLASGRVDIAFAPGLEHDFEDIPGRIVMAHFQHMHIHVANDHPLSVRNHVRFKDLNDETIILYPAMQDPFVRELQLQLLQRSGIRFRIYPHTCTPYYYDTLVSFGKGIRLFNWNDRLAPNTRMLTVEDPGYDTWLYLLYSEENQNPAIKEFIDGFIHIRNERT